jgi:hypothetical protein
MLAQRRNVVTMPCLLSRTTLQPVLTRSANMIMDEFDPTTLANMQLALEQELSLSGGHKR